MPSAARRCPPGFCAPPSSLLRRWSSILVPRSAGSRRPSPFQPVLAGALAGLPGITGLPCIMHRGGEERMQLVPPLTCVDPSVAMACLLASIRPNTPQARQRQIEPRPSCNPACLLFTELGQAQVFLLRVGSDNVTFVRFRLTSSACLLHGLVLLPCGISGAVEP